MHHDDAPGCGTIAMHGIYDGASASPQSVAIVGGTGTYVGVLGQFTGRNVGATDFDGRITITK